MGAPVQGGASGRSHAHFTGCVNNRFSLEFWNFENDILRTC